MMGKFDGETFFGWVVDFFLGGAGGEENASGHGQKGRSLDDARFQTAPFVIYYILRSGSFVLNVWTGFFYNRHHSDLRRPSPHI